MLRVTLDGVEQSFEAPSTWGALLSRLDESIAPRQRIVSDVRFDGLDEPAFRDPAVLDRPLAGLALVEVESGTPASLMERSLLEARGALPVLAAAALQVGESFRTHDVGAASQGLIELAEGLSSLVGIVGATGLAFHVDLDALRTEGRPMSAMVGELTGHLDDLIQAQEAGDWITVADILQYDVEPTLRRWAPLLDGLGTALSDARPRTSCGLEPAGTLPA